MNWQRLSNGALAVLIATAALSLITPGGARATTVFLSLPFNINGVAGSSSQNTLTSLDDTNSGGDDVFMTAAYAAQYGATGLPLGFGATQSTGNNVLQFGVHGQSLSATLTASSGQYSSFDVTALAINGGDYLGATIYYTDGTSTVDGYQFVPDWYGQGPYNRYTIYDGQIDSRGFGFTDLVFLSDSTKTVSDIVLNDYSGNLDVFGATGNELTPVPEPASLALFGAALAGLGWIRRRKTSQRPQSARVQPHC